MSDRDIRSKKLYLLLSLILTARVLLNGLEIDERLIYQLIFKAYDIDQEEELFQDLQNGIGGVQLIWGSNDKEETRKLTTKIYQLTQTPPFIAIDYEGGSVYLHQTHGLLNIPSNMAIARSSDTKNTTVLFYLVGLELKKAGINTIFAPTIDVNTNPKNPIINVRAFSDDPQIVYEFAKAMLEGITPTGILTTLKHFPGHGMVDTDSHLKLPKTLIDPLNLYQTHIYPFKRIIGEKRSDMVMVSHILYKMIDEKYPASLSEIIMKRILREELGFEGIILTDSLDMKAITSNYSIEDASVISLKRGADMVLIGRYPSKKVVDRIKKAVYKGELTLQDIMEKYKRILQIKEKHRLKEFIPHTDEFDIAYKKIATEISLKSLRAVKCQNIKDILSAKSLDILFIVPPRYLKEAISFYTAIKQLNPQAILYTDIKKLKKEKKDSTSSIIVSAYFWPYITQTRAKQIKEILKNYNHSLYINLLNPYDSEFFIDEFDCIIETYGINEFSIDALKRYLTNLTPTN